MTVWTLVLWKIFLLLPKKWLKSIHWVNSFARSSFFEKHIILTKPFQPARADISCSFFEKHIIVQNFLLSEWTLDIIPFLFLSFFRLIHDDKKSAETACLALSRLAESYKNDKAKLKDIAKAGVLTNLQKILATGGGTVSSQTFVTVMHILVVSYKY